MTTGRLILVSAPSGAGKTSLVNALLKQDNQLVVSVSHTTRPIRPGEKDNINYHFTDEATFAEMVDKNAFFEHAMVFGNRYGTAKHSVEQQLAEGKDVILEIDWQGAEQIRAMAPDCLSIFILPPTPDSLRERLIQRGQDAPESIERRLSEAEQEISKAPHFQYIVVNDNFDRALADLVAVISTARLASEVQIRDNPIVQKLIEKW